MIAAVLVGCSKSGDKKKDDVSANNEQAANKPEDIAIVTTGGKNTRMDEKTRKALWDISWESANLMMIDGQQSGQMFKVKGTTYTEGAIASTFSGDHAEADKAANRLVIEGNVRVKSQKTAKTPETTMIAKKVEWLPDLKVFKASGDVIVESEQAVIGPTNQLFVSAELDRIGTSQEYFKK